MLRKKDRRAFREGSFECNCEILKTTARRKNIPQTSKLHWRGFIYFTNQPNKKFSGCQLKTAQTQQIKMARDVRLAQLARSLTANQKVPSFIPRPGPGLNIFRHTVRGQGR